MHKMQKVKTVYIDPNTILKHTDKVSISIVFSMPGNWVFLFAQLCGNGTGMGTVCSKRCGNGLETGTRIYFAGR